MDFSKNCRVCTQPFELDYIDLDTPFNEITFYECFNYCTKLEASLCDGLPSSVCGSCSDLMQNAYYFITAALEADNFFRQRIEQFNVAEDDYAKNLSNDEGNEFDEILSKVPNDRKLEDKDIVCWQENLQPQNEEQMEDDYELIDAAEKDTEVELTPFEFQDITDENLVDEQLIDDKSKVKRKRSKAVPNPICNEWTLSNDEHFDEHKIDNKEYRCNKCGDEFKRGIHLKTHILQFHRKLRDGWYCAMCGESFECEEKLKTHKNADHRDKPLGLCITCGKSMIDEKALQLHVMEEHRSRRIPVECPYCNRKYQLKCLSMHVEYTHPDIVSASVNNGFTCKHCFHVCENNSDLEDHIRIHLAKDDYWCAECNEDFKTKRVFDDHKFTIHHVEEVKKVVIQCKECDFSTPERDVYLKHKKAHNNQNYKPKRQTFLCAQCPAKFKNPKALTDHEDFKHGEKKSAHACDLCNKKFVKNALLRYHKISAHGNDRPFKCSQCPKLFKLKRHLTMHENRHNGEKNFECPHCDKKYLQQCHLKVHLRSHTGELPFECHLCDRKFAIRSRLTYHVARHKGVVHKCEHCPQTYDNMTKLRFHTFKHIGYPYVCDFCQKGHPSRNRYFCHVKTKHKIVLTNEELDDNASRNLKSFYRNTKTQVEPDPSAEIEFKLEY